MDVTENGEGFWHRATIAHFAPAGESNDTPARSLTLLRHDSGVNALRPGFPNPARSV
jgi:hypothetical protein